MLSGREDSDLIGACLARRPVTVLSVRPTRRRRQPVKEASNMANSIARDEPSVKVIVGVDTHKHEHVAVAINDLGAR